jgi:hypothetical protein
MVKNKKYPMFKSLIEFHEPFEDINDYLKATYIVKQKYFKVNDNIQEIKQCFKDLLDVSLNDTQIIKFINRLLEYPNQYLYSTISDFDNFENEVYEYSCEKNQSNVKLTPPINKCQHCVKSDLDPNWYTNKNAIFTRECLYYTSAKISKFLLFTF